MLNLKFGFALFLLALPALALAKTDDFTTVFYYTEGKKSFASFQKNAKYMDVIAPQVYSANAKGELSGSPSGRFLEVARVNRLKIMPLIVNSKFSSTTMDKILDDPTVQDKIIDAMIAEAKEYDYWGWQFDFEQMWADRRDKYTAFAKRAYPRLKAAGLKFSVAVIAQTSLSSADYPRDLWRRVIGVYDYKELGANADFLSLMTYDQADSGGPVASLPWVKKVIQFALTQVPARKLSLGIPFYFWKWDARSGKLVDIGGYGRVAELAGTDQAVKWGWDADHQVAYVDYFKNRKKYTAWYENAKSFGRKLDLAMLYNLHGFSAWALGLEDPKIYPVIKQRAI
jgi:spore germination protein YaaH